MDLSFNATSSLLAANTITWIQIYPPKSTLHQIFSNTFSNATRPGPSTSQPVAEGDDIEPARGTEREYTCRKKRKCIRDIRATWRIQIGDRKRQSTPVRDVRATWRNTNWRYKAAINTRPYKRNIKRACSVAAPLQKAKTPSDDVFDF